MSKEGVPETRIFPPNEDPKVTRRKYELMLSLLKGELDSISAKDRPTVMDFQGLNTEATEQDFLDWIERETGIPEEHILADSQTKESQKAYILLGSAYVIARQFLLHTLKYQESELPKDPQVLSSKNDIFSLLSKTKLAGGSSGLSQHIKYCRAVKTTIAAFETLKHDAMLLESLTKEFEGALVSSPSSADDKSTPLVAPMGFGGEKSKFFMAGNPRIEGDIETRAKKIESALLKFINRPEANAKAALVDGIATRLTVTPEKARGLLPVLCHWLEEEMGVSFVKLENTHFFSEADEQALEKELKKTFTGLQFSFSRNDPNSASQGTFISFSLKGSVTSMDVESDDKENGHSRHARQFEIQLVAPENQNEKGGMHHSVYNIVKLMMARTRIDGACPKSVFEEFIKDASKKSGLSIDQIHSFLLEGEDAPIVRNSKKRGEVFYVSRKVYERWDSFGWVDSRIMSDINNGKK